jgi:hypothetical protein
MTRGNNFNVYSLEPTPRCTATQWWLEYTNDGPGLLFWGPGDKVKVKGQELRLESLTDIYVGKKLPTFQHAIASAATEKLCFSMTTTTSQFHIEAQSPAHVSTWLAGLNYILSQPVSIAPESEALSSKVIAPSNALAKGMDVVLYTSKGEKVKKFLFFETDSGMGCVYACDRGKRIQTSDKLPVATLIDMYTGLHKDVFTVVKPTPRADLCLSLLGAEGELHVECPSKGEVEAWFTALQEKLAEGGLNVAVTAIDGDSGRRASVVSGRTDPTVSPQDSVAVMKTGANFVCYDPARRDVLMAYDEHDGSKYGSMYWQPAHGTGPRQSIRLDMVTDIYIGKRHGAFQTRQTEGTVESRCMSIIARKNVAFHGEAPSGLVLKTWLAGLNYILSSKVLPLSYARISRMDNDLDTHKHVHVHLHTYIHTDTHTHTHTHTHAHTHTHTHTHIHPHTNTHTHTHTQKQNLTRRRSGK